MELTGDSPPTEEEVENIFNQMTQTAPGQIEERASSRELENMHPEIEGKHSVELARQQTRQTLAEAGIKEETGEQITDVLFDIPTLRVDEIKLNVDNLDARVALDATVANLVRIVVGAQVGIGRVEFDIKGVEAQAILKVKLRQVYAILARALDTLDRNPVLIQSLLQPVTEAVGSLGKEAGRAVGEVGTQAGKALGPGGALGDTIKQVGETARETLRPGGLVGQSVGDLGEVAKGVTASEGPVKEAVKDVSEGVDQAIKGQSQVKEKERRRFYRHDKVG